MKLLIYPLLLIFILGSNELSAQFKLKKLDDVIVSMGEGENIADYQLYLSNYFDRIEMTDDVKDKGEFQILSAGDSKFLQGSGINENSQKVIYRVKVSISDDGHIISRIKDSFKIQMCVAKTCNSCVFENENNCRCEGGGECDFQQSL